MAVVTRDGFVGGLADACSNIPGGVQLQGHSLTREKACCVVGFAANTGQRKPKCTFAVGSLAIELKLVR